MEFFLVFAVELTLRARTRTQPVGRMSAKVVDFRCRSFWRTFRRCSAQSSGREFDSRV